MSDEKQNERPNPKTGEIRAPNKGLPKSWLYGFSVVIAFTLLYVLNYHVLSTPIFGGKNAAANRPGATGKAALTDAADLAAGEAIFMGQRNLCHTCHRKDLGGLVGPNLTDDMWRNGCTVDEMVQNVITGFPKKGMLPYGSTQRLTDRELLQVVSFVISKRGSNPKNPKPIDPERDKPCTR